MAFDLSGLTQQLQAIRQEQEDAKQAEIASENAIKDEVVTKAVSHLNTYLSSEEFENLLQNEIINSAKKSLSVCKISIQILTDTSTQSGKFMLYFGNSYTFIDICAFSTVGMINVYKTGLTEMITKGFLMLQNKLIGLGLSITKTHQPDEWEPLSKVSEKISYKLEIGF